MPQVTVLMAVYNGEKYLVEAVDSILNQTFRDFEFVVVDDGSTDNTAQILANYGRRDARLRVLTQSNQGLAASLNRGLAAATGQLVARMDADDISQPKRLEHQVEFLSTQPNIGVSGTWVKTFGESRGDVWRYPVRDDAVRSQLMLGCPFAHPTVMMRTDVVRAVSGYRTEYTITEDYELWLRLADQTAFANMPTVLLMHRLHAGQVCGQDNAHGRVKSETQKIHLRVLEQLGVVPSNDELYLHASLCAAQLAPEREFVLRMAAWLEKLDRGNRNARVFPVRAFTQLLGYRWWATCWAAQSLGMWTWRQFWRSPLSYQGEIRPWRAGWLGINCVRPKLRLGWH